MDDAQLITPDAKLAELTAAYESSPQVRLDRAKAELERLESDPFHANKVLTSHAAQSDVARLKSQIALAEADFAKAAAAELDPVDLAIVGAIPDNWTESGPGAWLRDQVDAVPTLRDAGLRDEVIRQILSDQTVSKIEYDAVANLQKRRMADPEWCKKLLANDHATVRESLLMSAVLASEIAA
jgi:hypothetical protein